MKTHNYLSGILTLAIGMMVNGQNTGITASANTDNTHASDLNTVPKKFLAPLENAMSETLAVPTNLESTTHLAVSPQTQAFLNQQAEVLFNKSMALRTLAKSKTGQERSNMIAEAILFEKKGELNQLAALEMAGELHLSAFRKNKITIRFLVSNIRPGKTLSALTTELIYASEKHMKLALEMREEAHSEPHISSRLGALSNAEEKELLALSEQSQAIEQLGHLQKDTSY